MRRILAVDYGHARIGLSLSDPLQIIASPLAAVRGSKNVEIAAKNVEAEITNRKLDIEFIVVGLPIHLDGKESERSNEVRAFAAALKNVTGKEVHLFDERLTTVQAERLLKDASISRKNRTPIIDGISSTILLQSFLDLRGLSKQ